MLKGIPSILSPELLKVLQAMGHGDRICIGDGNFPAESVARARGAQLIRLDGIAVPELLEAILALMPLDEHVEHPVTLMERSPGDDADCSIWEVYSQTVERRDPRGRNCISFVERFRFYDEAKDCFAVVATGETALYANIILQKGVVKD